MQLPIIYFVTMDYEPPSDKELKELSRKKEWNEKQIREVIRDELENNLFHDFYYYNVLPLKRQINALGVKPVDGKELTEQLYSFLPLTGEINPIWEEQIDPNEQDSKYHKFFTDIYTELQKEGYLPKPTQKQSLDFIKAFNEDGVKNGLPHLEWKHQSNLCPYLIDILIDKKIIRDYKRNKIAESVFSVNDPMGKRNSYWNNKARKPRNHEIIDKIIDANLST